MQKFRDTVYDKFLIEPFVSMNGSQPPFIVGLRMPRLRLIRDGETFQVGGPSMPLVRPFVAGHNRPLLRPSVAAANMPQDRQRSVQRRPRVPGVIYQNEQIDELRITRVWSLNPNAMNDNPAENANRGENANQEENGKPEENTEHFNYH